MIQRKDYFDFMLNQVKRTAAKTGNLLPQAFGHDRHLGKHELVLKNPRVVNGSQTLHSIKDVENPSSMARVMVRIIEVPADNGDEFSEQVQKKKEIIHKISVRSNQQNPIKPYNLVANDAFQHELSRYFHDKGWFYERRPNEWRYKKLHYTSFKIIRKTPPIRAYQLYLLAELNDRSLRRLAERRRYVRNLKGHVDFSSFAWLCKILRDNGVTFGKENVNESLERAHEADDDGWEIVVKAVVDLIDEEFQKVSSRVSKQEGIKLTTANYFKNATYIGDLMAKPVSGHLRRIAGQLLT